MHMRVYTLTYTDTYTYRFTYISTYVWGKYIVSIFDNKAKCRKVCPKSIERNLQRRKKAETVDGIVTMSKAINVHNNEHRQQQQQHKENIAWHLCKINS